ncbi:stonustoxin subunit beta-like [Takifugu rubripes]|uniref:stonustoxin subunit beta-like n=1 Tax=Takifugu rubripes TaxID=31033 RepID=UPI001145F8AD|nr:stonustoxin subunit beta-like [Takifugu rubripes]
METFQTFGNPEREIGKVLLHDVCIWRNVTNPALRFTNRIKSKPVQADPKSGTNSVELKVEVASVEPLSCLGFHFLCVFSQSRLDHCGKERLKCGVKKYHCQLSVDINTVHRSIQVSNNRVMRRVAEDQPYPAHPERFEDCPQLLCSNSLTGRCYWEVEWTGFVYISVAYKKIWRHGSSPQRWFGRNQQSWSLVCSDSGYSVLHDDKRLHLPALSSTDPQRVAVYLNYPAGTVTFYRFTTNTLVHLYTFKTTFTEPLFPGFGFGSWSWFSPGSSVHLCSTAGEASV